MKYQFAVWAMALFVTVTGFNAIAKEQALDRVVAIVDEDVVLESELVRRVNGVIEQLEKRKQPLPSLKVLREQVLDRLILESLQLQMARRAGVRISDAELDATLKRVAAENKLDLDTMKAQIERDGTPWSVFREDLRHEIMIARVRNGMVARRIQISEREVENLVKLMEREGLNRSQYLLHHILLPIPENASAEEVAKVRELAQKIVSDLRNGASFEEYAVTYSKGQNALEGGSLGWRGFNQLPTLFADTVKNMKKGEISEPLRSGSGLHILRLTDKKGGFETHSVTQTHVRHILIQPNAILDDKAAYDKIMLIRDRILAGEDFAELAKEFSDDKSNAMQGGDMKWVNPGTFVPEFEKAMNKLAINELSEPVKTQFGWHLIEVLGRRDQDQTEEMKKQRAYRILQNRKFEEEVELWLRELKDQAYIKIIEE